MAIHVPLLCLGDVTVGIGFAFDRLVVGFHVFVQVSVAAEEAVTF